MESPLEAHVGPPAEYNSRATSGSSYPSAGEKVIQGFLAAYLSWTDYFVFRSEVELGKGHADISLEPLMARSHHGARPAPNPATRPLRARHRFGPYTNW